MTQQYQEGGSNDPMAQLVQAAVQVVQAEDYEGAMQIAQALAQMGQAQPQETPVFRKGGPMVKEAKKKDDKDKSKLAKMYKGKKGTEMEAKSTKYRMKK